MRERVRDSLSSAIEPAVGPGVLRVGETCWRTARAGRAAFLVDTEA
ncbi:MAG: hypothetical protein ACXWKO_08330 [Phenylobacterium sp.]